MNKRNQIPFYRPADGKVGDVMPCYFDGKFHLYYLRYGTTTDGREDNEYSVRETTDFVHFSEDRRVQIYGGTGEIIKHEGKYHLFKCGGEKNGVTFMHHYTGETPYSFQLEEDILPSDDNIYVPWAWRDPRIFWVEEEGCYWMLVATNKKTENPVHRNACIGLCKSKDLHHWSYCEPLFSPLALEGTYECPDMFKIGDWYYLTYGNANHNKMTHYVKSKSMYGPWIIPKDDTIDSFLFYAGRVATDGKHHYIAAWNADRTGADLSMKMGLRDVEKCIREPEEDFAPFGYAGNMVIHQLSQRDNGDLMCRPIPAVLEQYQHQPVVLSVLQGGEWSETDGNISVHSKGGYACAMAGKLSEHTLIDMDIQASGHEVGIVVGATTEFIRRGLFLRLQLEYGRVQVMSGLREIGGWNGYCMPFAVEMEKFVKPDERGCYHLTVMQDHDVLCLYINGEALSMRAQNARGGQLGLYAYDADAVFSNIRIGEMCES